MNDAYIRHVPRDESIDPTPARPRPTLADHYKHMYEVQRRLSRSLVIILFFFVLTIMIGGPILGRVADDHTAEARVEEQTACEARVEEERARTYSLVCSGERQCPDRSSLPPRKPSRPKTP